MFNELEIKEVKITISKWFHPFPVKVKIVALDGEHHDLPQNCPILHKVQKTGMDFYATHHSCDTCVSNGHCLPETFILKAITMEKRVVGALLVTALDGQEAWLRENSSQIEWQLELCAEWISKKIENEELKKAHHSILEEINGVFSMIQDSVLIVGADGTVHNLTHSVSFLFNKARIVLMGENITDLLSVSDWQKMKNTKKQQELNVTVKAAAGKQGAFSAAVKPLHTNGGIDSFLIKLTPIIDSKKERNEQRILYSFLDVKGTSAAIQNAIAVAKRVAPSDATVLLRGESGTGKEVFAQAIHQASDRKNGPFIAINCAAIPESLLESELFGHVKGAFTGSMSDKPGRFELANGGTIFLDEIGDIPFPLQAKLLRVVQERKIERVGDTKSTPVNVRIITATHRNLEELVANGQFREDLYYRLNVIPITIPPLRERREDIPILIDYYLDKFSKEHIRAPKRISEDVYELLLSNPWPGNIRELQNVINHVVQLEIGDLVTIKSLPDYLLSDSENEPKMAARNPIPPAKADNHKENKEIILQLLDQFGRDTIGKKKVASHLNISLPTLYRKINKMKIK